MSTQRWVILSIILYVVAACIDNLMTWKYVVVEHRYYEANPYKPIDEPLWVWFAEDILALCVAIAVSYGFQRFTLWISRGEPLEAKRKFEKIASRYWVIVMSVAMLRVLPVIHNMLLVVFHVQTPLPRLLRH